MENTDYHQPASTGSQPRPAVGFSQALKNNFKYLFHFSGRASRSEFWWVYGTFYLVTLVMAIILSFAIASRVSEVARFNEASTQYVTGEITRAEYEALAESSTEPAYGVIVLLILLGLWGLITLVCTIAVSWRRLQDAGFHGAFYLLTLVALGIVPFVMYFFPSSPKGYQYDKPADIGRP
ncbi:DUF805 domain-containing protein [Rothia nasisuis]|uniref:DUF805 domain-containing protein n=1 Tax=Rothia nasisuis TaxID=2109647 RepID=UPI001F1C5AC6|nr:DUF805 domain-containing protein [Rothia nasisuis]